MIFFKYVYYLIALVFIIAELFKIANIKAYTENFVKYLKWVKTTTKEKKLENMPKEMAIFSVVMFFISILEFFWLGIGLFTYNWQFIVGYLGLVLIFSLFYNKRTPKISMLKMVSIGFWSVFSLLFYIFLIINTFQLHIQLF